MLTKVTRMYRFIRDFKQNGSFPKVANYEITARCNLNCEHCYWKKGLKGPQELSSEQWTRVFAEHRERGMTFAFLTGGEPALRMDVVRAADRMFTGLAIATNGVVPIPRDINRRLFVSLDGPRDVHNRIRGKDIFDTVVENYRGDSRVVISPTLSVTNYEYIDELIEITRRMDVGGITFSLYTSHLEQDDPLLLTGEKLEWTVNKLNRAIGKHGDLMLMTPYVINLFRDKQHHEQCFFRGRNFVSYDAELNAKHPCVLGEGINCRTCGCIVPVISYSLRKGNLKSWLMLNRMFPASYFRAVSTTTDG